MFDVDTQRTVTDLDEAKITPVFEEPLSDTKRLELIQTLEKLSEKYKKKTELSEIETRTYEVLLRDIERLKEKTNFPSIDKYIPFFTDEPSTIIEYLSDDFIIFFVNLIIIRSNVTGHY